MKLADWFRGAFVTPTGLLMQADFAYSANLAGDKCQPIEIRGINMSTDPTKTKLPPDPRVVFAENLREVMHTQRLKQEHIADICGVSRSKVSRWLSAKMLPGPEDLQKLSAGLFWSYERMFSYHDPDADDADTRLAKMEKLGDLERVAFMIHTYASRADSLMRIIQAKVEAEFPGVGDIFREERQKKEKAEDRMRAILKRRGQ